MVSVCLIAGAAVWLAAAGYSLQLSPPSAHAHNPVPTLGGWGYGGPYFLAEDGSVFTGSYNFVTGAVEFQRRDIPPISDAASPPVPTSEIAYWSRFQFVTVDGLYYVYDVNGDEWHSAPLPGLAVGTNSSSASGLKGRYKASN